MAHIVSIGAGIYSRLLVETVPTRSDANPRTGSGLANTEAFSRTADYKGGFVTADSPGGTVAKAAGGFTWIPNMREAPSFGVPPSLVNVPNFGSATSKQVQGQADPTNIELAINYVPQEWVRDRLGQFVNDGEDHLMAIVLLNSAPPADFVLTSASVGNVPNSFVYFVGSIAAIQFTPNLADSNQGTVTIALKSEFSDPQTL